jgi:DNA-binding transcriptional MocR family regulator
MWTPNLRDKRGPLYDRLRNAIIFDIRNGTLKPGDQLPPHRELAEKIGVSVGTVSRAFGELVRQGLVEAGARRGSRIKNGLASDSAAVDDRFAPTRNPMDLRGHRAAVSDWNEEIKKILLDLGLGGSIEEVMDYHPGPGPLRSREAGARWLELTSNSSADPDEVVVCNGAQHALMCTLLTVCTSGDLVATERLTYPGLKIIAQALGLKLVPVEIDENGLIPDSFADVCKTHPIQALVCVPNVHSPTTRTLPLKRRDEIVQIALENGVTIIEDDVYGGLAEAAMTPFFSLSPQCVIRITGLSKTLGPGLRIGYIQTTQDRISALSKALRTTTWTTSPLGAEVASTLVLSGQAEKILAKNKNELFLRNQIIAEELQPFELTTSPFSPHAWLELPETWTRDDLAAWSQASGVLVLMADYFSVGATMVDQAVRICGSAAFDADALRTATRLMAKALANHPEDNNTLA